MVHFEARRWVGREVTCKHWVVMRGIRRHHSLGKTSERGSREVLRWRMHSKIGVHTRCRRIHWRSHPRMISRRRRHLVRRWQQHACSTIHEIPEERILSWDHWYYRLTIRAESRTHHSRQWHAHVWRIWVEKLELLCELVTAQFFSALWILSMHVFLGFVLHLFLNRHNSCICRCG